MRLALLLLLVLVAVPTVWAQRVTQDRPTDKNRWLSITEGPSMSMYFDTRTVDGNDPGGGLVTAWVWRAHAEAQHPGRNSYDRVLHRYRLDCMAQTNTLLEAITYRAGNLVASSAYAPHQQVADTWAPDTEGEAIADAVCAYTFPPAPSRP